MDVLFWFSLALIAYVYAGYPVLLGLWAAVRARTARPWHVPDSSAGGQLGVSIIVAARDEAARLPGRIENLLALDYPAELIQIIVASDGSTDDTDTALAPYRDRVTVLVRPPAGKASALNAAVAHAIHPILVFADARQRFAADAVTRLVAHFADPSIGAVSGELVLDCEISDEAAPTTSTIGDSVGAYWKYEKWLRRREAIVGSTLGVTGAIYAMRRWLWQPLPADTILDDVLGPMRVVLRGYRVVFEPGARAFDRAAADASVELNRKVRTLAGNFQILAREPWLLVPVANPVWLQFISHKVGRLVVPYALAALFVSNAWLAGTSAFYAVAFAGQLAFYGLAVYGAVLERRARSAVGAASEVFHEAA